MTTSRDIVSIIELVFYLPCTILTILLIFKHGYRRPATWLAACIPLFLLEGLRLAGAGLELASRREGREQLFTRSLILDAIGLAPLLLALIGLLRKAHAGLPRDRSAGFLVFMPFQVVTVGATVITAVGGRQLFGGSDPALGRKLMRAGVFVFLASFLFIMLLALWTLRKVDKSVGGGHTPTRRALYCLFFTAPLVVIRLAYSVVSSFEGQESVFNPFSASATATWVHFAMVIVMEGLVTAAILLTGIFSREPPTTVTN